MTLGLAQQLFIERTGGPRFKAMDTQSKDLCRVYSESDRLLAEAIAKDANVPETVRLLLCHIAAAARHGHLCVRLEQDAISPGVGELLGLPHADAKRLEALLCQGATELPSSLTAIVRDDDCLYLQKHWIYETSFLRHLERVRNATPEVTLDMVVVKTAIQALLLQPEQAQAIMQSCVATLTLIIGGPGTGKSYTAGQLLSLVWRTLTPEQRPSFKISLAAPTGKAAANLEASVKRAADLPELHAQTLHSLLKMRESAQILDADLILVDECSMIDAKLMAQLFSSVKTGARLILMGDADQLPAVEAGGLFADLVHAYADSSIACRLTTCLRTDSRAILDLATAIRNGESETAQRLLQAGGDVTLLPLGKATEAQHRHLIEASPNMDLEDTESLLASLKKFRILSPLRHGPWGVGAVNKVLLQQALQRRSQVIPILITVNDYHLKLFNGDIGLLVRPNPTYGEVMGPGDYAVFPTAEGARRLPAAALPSYDFAYCLSVHKCQGSEYDKVLLLLPDGSERFGRELLYTAVTRARRQVEIWGSMDLLTLLLTRSRRRISGIECRWMKSQASSRLDTSPHTPK